MNISSEAFVLGCSAIGAGLALIAGIGPGVVPSDLAIVSLDSSTTLRLFNAGVYTLDGFQKFSVK